MKKFPSKYQLMLVTFQILLLIVSGCKTEIDDPASVETSELKRMPSSQTTFLLDYRDGMSYVYSVSYDYSGLTGNATLTPVVCVEGAAHLTITPSTIENIDPALVIVNNGIDYNKVYVVPVSGSESIDENLYLAPEFGFDIYSAEGGSLGRITQVDFDQNNHLFIAGSSGFYEVYYSNKSNTALLGYDIYNSDPETHQLIAEAYAPGISITTTLIDDDNSDIEVGDYIENPVFNGGDILFTQNSEETAGMESEVLLAFTQQDDQAMLVEMNSDDNTLWAYQLFTLRKNKTKYESVSSGTDQNVTGAALVGDNLLMTSHHNSTTFSVWTLGGEEVATPTIEYPTSIPDGWAVPSDGTHNWGDMASYQVFDNAEIEDMSTTNGRIIPPGDDDSYAYEVWPWCQYWSSGCFSIEPEPYNVQFAQVKLYRQDTSIEGDGLNFTASNADIVDLRYPPEKYTSLVGDGSEIFMKVDRFYANDDGDRAIIEVAAWYDHTLGDYYMKSADVYMNECGDYGEILEIDNWHYLGTIIAYGRANYFKVPTYLESVDWIKIVSRDDEIPVNINFVAVYNYNPDVFYSHNGIGYTLESFAKGGCEIIPELYEIHPYPYIFDEEELSKIPKPEGKSRAIGILMARIDDGYGDYSHPYCIYEMHDDGSIKPIGYLYDGDEGQYNYCYVWDSMFIDDQLSFDGMNIKVYNHQIDNPNHTFYYYFLFDADRTMAENTGRLYYTSYNREYLGCYDNYGYPYPSCAEDP